MPAAIFHYRFIRLDRRERCAKEPTGVALKPPGGDGRWPLRGRTILYTGNLEGPLNPQLQVLRTIGAKFSKKINNTVIYVYKIKGFPFYYKTK